MENETVITTLNLDRAVTHAIGAVETEPLGDHSVSRLVPDGYTWQTKDVRDHDNYPARRTGVSRFVDADSLIAYTDHYATEHSIPYANDTIGANLLSRPFDLVDIVLNEHPATGTDHRDHRAILTIKPTPQAMRWGQAIGTTLNQEQFLDLVVDGVAEIASPPSAELRDLVSDLHSIRSSEVASVIRTGGQGTIAVTENVKLHAGTGTEVAFPEMMSVTFTPFVGWHQPIGLHLRIKPKVQGNKVLFELTCPDLDAVLAETCSSMIDAVNVALAATILDRHCLNRA